MSGDGRIAAWLHAWERIQALQEFKLKHAPAMDSELPDGYWGVVAEAQVLATLASADILVGISVGDILQEQERQKQESRDRATAMVEKMAEKKKAKEYEDPSCTCAFDDSQCPIHAQGDDIADNEEGASDGPSE